MRGLRERLVDHDRQAHGRWLVLVHDPAQEQLVERRAFHERHRADHAYDELHRLHRDGPASVGLIDLDATRVVRTDAPAGDPFFVTGGYR